MCIQGKLHRVDEENNETDCWGLNLIKEKYAKKNTKIHIANRSYKINEVIKI